MTCRRHGQAITAPAPARPARRLDGDGGLHGAPAARLGHDFRAIQVRRQPAPEDAPRRPPLTLPPVRLNPDALKPPPPAAQDPGGAAAAPSRISLLDAGRFSLGLRLGFPEPEALKDFPALERARLVEERLTGRVPSGWEAVDKAKLATAVWGIFAENIAPDFAKRITSGLSRPKAPGLAFELDLVLLTDFSGGGVSFTVQLP